jgi:Flp pilus assembly protein TadG
MMPPQKSERNERGVVIIWTAFFMLMMLGFVALGIDVAKVMATRTELQNAADAAALAGASALDLTTGQIRPDSATMRAQWTSAQNKAFVDAPVSVTLLAGDVQVNSVDNTVKVTVRRNPATDGSMITHVAQVLGIKNVEINATATAKAERTCQQCERLVPLGAIPPGGAAGFTVGCATTYTLLEGQGDAVNGNYKALSFPDCNEGDCGAQGSTGASTLGCLIEHGYACCIGVGDLVLTKPGQNAGQVRSGLQARWDRDTDRTPDICYSAYRGNGSRVVNVPVVLWLGNGRTDVRVVGFSAFFLKRRPTGSGQPVYAEFVYDVVPGTGGNCNSTAFTIRLIE